MLCLLLFLLVSQAHGICEHNGATPWQGGAPTLQADTHLDSDVAATADLCAVCVALNSARPLPAFAMLPPGDRTAKPRAFVYVFKPDTGWHAPLACRPPPSFA